MSYLWIGLAGGALAFAHCLGMCGGFALHLSQGSGGPQGGLRQAVARQLLWHAGRTTTYVFLGALAGFSGLLVGSVAGAPWVQNVLSYVAGAVMVASGMALLGLLPWRSRKPTGPSDRPGGLLSSLFTQLFRDPTPGGALVMGLATGFLPCPVTLGFLALAAQSGSVPAGMGTMLAVGVGTAWALLLVGLAGHLIRFRLRRWTLAVGGVVLVLLGAVTALRGTDALHRALGCPGAPPSQAASSGHDDCCRPNP